MAGPKPHDRTKFPLQLVQNFLMTGPKHPYDSSKASSKAVPHRLRFKSSHFNFQYPLVSFRVSSSCLRLLPHLPITLIFLLYFFHSITYFRKQFLRNPWPFQFAFLPITVCRIFISSFTPRDVFSFCTRWSNSLSPNEAQNILCSVKLSWKRGQKLSENYKLLRPVWYQGNIWTWTELSIRL